MNLQEINKEIKEFKARTYTYQQSQDINLRCFNVALARLFDSRNVAVMLQQLQFWWTNQKGVPFYKYNTKCSFSKQGDSWTEELFMSEYEVQKALKAIGKKVTSKAEAEAVIAGNEYAVAFYTSPNNRTWYFVNSQLIDRWRQFAEVKFAESLPNPKRREMTASEEVAAPEDRGKTLRTPTEKSLASDPKILGSNYRATQSHSEPDICPPDEISKISEEGMHTIEEKSRKKQRKPLTPQQKYMIKAKPMPIDYSVSSATMDRLEKEGYDSEGLEATRKRHFLYYTAGKGKTVRSQNWDATFEEWVLRDYSQGYVRKDGEFYKENPHSKREQYYIDMANREPINWDTYDPAAELRRINELRLAGEVDY